MTDHYTKLWSQILDSTLWHQDKNVILLWIVMLAKKDREHIVRTPVPTLASLAKLTIPECEQALAKLNAKDPYSHSKAEGGRRIIKTPEGYWFIVNGQYYQDHLRKEQRRAAVAKANRDLRARKKAGQ